VAASASTSALRSRVLPPISRTARNATAVVKRSSTSATGSDVREMGGKTRERKADVDALAATVLLQQAMRMQVLPSVDPLDDTDADPT
jgi:hypothetical protein